MQAIMNDRLLKDDADIRRELGAATADALKAFARKARRAISLDEYYESDWVADNEDAQRQKGKRATPHLHEADVRASHFGACRTIYAPGRSDVVRNVDSVVAGYYSTSYAAPRYSQASVSL